MARLTVPLDAAGIDGFDPKQPVKVLLTSGGKPIGAQSVSLDKKGQGEATFDVDEKQTGLRIIVGPPDATDEELTGLQTIGVDIPKRRFGGREQLVIPAIRITPYYWFWWLRWCRTFTVHGRILCPDGSPVPGAVVCAYDVDAWWWWWSKQQVGCATTDANGAFTLTFRWCCGWWPWWWLRLRRWYVEPRLSDIILRALQREPRFPRPPFPEPTPDLGIFDRLLGQQSPAPSLGRTALAAPALSRVDSSVGSPVLADRAKASVAGRALTTRNRAVAAVDPTLLDGLRDRLVRTLPSIPALEAVRLWPWHPWQPWWDCTPDLVFRATQTCGGSEQVIVDEGWFNARWNVPQVSNVTLTASNDACCVPINDCTEGECLALAKVCSIDADEVGGNPGADLTPVGYAYPNAIANGGDAPFAGRVDIRGTTPCLSDVDFYEIEYSPDGGVSWAQMPAPALGTFTREYWDFVLGTDVDVPFSAQVPIDGRHVYETLEHYEATHTPADWGASKVWLGTNIDMVVPWVSAPTFGDGTYSLRVIGYDEAAGVLSNARILNVCDSNTESRITVTIDNQSSFPAPGPVDNPCGSGTTHNCTNEPETDILDARIVRAAGGTTAIGACGEVRIEPGDMLEVDFVAHDAQGHLAWYSLIATYGENLSRNLIGLGGALSALPGGAPPVPAAAQVGPDYAAARTLPQNAAAPTWTGGAIRLSISAAVAFPESCCYQLELRAYKRTIVDCLANNAHRNLSERSFQVSV
ncbi:MAG: carboxypeptidase regulatory-like domain-containing protein [Gemmatimonadaceae bacterium]|nr:carboxypeptidase regulatory-like domain-containing protein [Gemmatimonadaceae bacterium]